MPAGEPAVAVLWPAAETATCRIARAVVLIALGVALLALSAKFKLVLPVVPMTLQTLVVLAIGATYGWRLGGLTVAIYVAVGALGLPVFAGPTVGLPVLTGPTAGYLLGFVVAAVAVGRLAELGWDCSVWRMFVAMAIGHVAILALGLAWLAFGMDLTAARAWTVGGVPFIGGAIVKNALGAVLVPVLRGWVDRRAL